MILPHASDAGESEWFLVIRPDARLWSFRLSGGMSTSTFLRMLAPPDKNPSN